jgi:hypothetical protein
MAVEPDPDAYFFEHTDSQCYRNSYKHIDEYANHHTYLNGDPNMDKHAAKHSYLDHHIHSYTFIHAKLNEYFYFNTPPQRYT